MTPTLNGSWDAASFFEDLTVANLLARSEGFTFCRVSGLDGFEEAVNQAQSQTAFVCVSDIADGYIDLNNTPRTRRVKTVFFAMRHAAEDMAARDVCMETMRELFRQFMSKLITEKVKLEEKCIYIDPRITFNEIDRYFFTGAAAAYFQIAVDVFTDLRYSSFEWDFIYDVWLMDPGLSSLKVIQYITTNTDYTLTQTKHLVDNAPSLICSKAAPDVAEKLQYGLERLGATVKLDVIHE